MIIIHKKGMTPLNFIRHLCIIVLPSIYEELWSGVALIINNLDWLSPFFYYIYICSVFVSFFIFPVDGWGRGWNLDFDQNLVYCSDDGTYAMKKVLIQNTEQLEMVREEIRVSSLFSHPNLLPLLDHAIISVKVTSHSDHSYLIYSYYSYIFLNIKFDTYTQNCYVTVALFGLL